METIGARQYIVAWYIWHITHDINYRSVGPNDLVGLIEHAESDLAKCDKDLSEMYSEYIPQKIR